MKKNTVLFLLFLSILSFGQEKINFETSSFAEILKKAKSENKLIFMDAYASWCGPCKLMDKNVFTDPAVKAYFDANFINAKIDMEKGEGRDLAIKYGIRSYPSLLVMNTDGEIVGKELGYLDAKQFLEFGKKNNNPKLVNTSLKDEYIKDQLDQPSLFNYILLSSTSDPILAKKASERYFSRKKDQTFSGDEIKTLLTFTQSVDDPNYKIFTANKKAITELLPEKSYIEFDNYLKLMKIINNNTDEKSGTINKDQILKEGQGLLTDDDLKKSLNVYILNFYSAHQNYPEYEKIAVDYYQSNERFNVNELMFAASVFNDHVTNPKSLKLATQWVEQIVMNSENFDSVSLLAQLYDKTGKKVEAKMFAETAIGLAEKEQRDPSKMIELLNK